jgi:hypothetical protein
MRVLTTAFAALTIAGLAIAPSAGASDLPISNPNQIVTEITVDDLAKLVTEIGGQQVETFDKGVTFQDRGVPYTLSKTACDSKSNKCFGLSMLVVVDNSKTSFPLETLDSANKENPLLNFFRVDGNNKFAAGRIGVVDGGVTRQHLGIEIALFAVSFQEAMKKMTSQLTTSLERSSPFQRASYGALPRPIRVSPDYAAHLGDVLMQNYKTTLRH